jgi:hypothetical protein
VAICDACGVVWVVHTPTTSKQAVVCAVAGRQRHSATHPPTPTHLRPARIPAVPQLLLQAGDGVPQPYAYDVVAAVGCRRGRQLQLQLGVGIGQRQRLRLAVGKRSVRVSQLLLQQSHGDRELLLVICQARCLLRQAQALRLGATQQLLERGAVWVC